MAPDELKALIGRVARKPADTLAGNMSLMSLGLSASFGLSDLRARLEAATRSRLQPIVGTMTVDQLFAQVSGAQVSGAQVSGAQVSGGQISGAAVAGAMPAVPAPPATGGLADPRLADPRLAGPRLAGPRLAGLGLDNLALGIDMQEIETMPHADDFRTHSFYKGHFSPAEIGTAMLRGNPRAHLCGLFCAKEAAKKSHRDLLNLRMTDLVVTHDPDGRPRLRAPSGELGRFQFILSITHTEAYASAACLTVWS